MLNITLIMVVSSCDSETTGTRRIEIKLGKNALQMVLSQINVLMKKADIKENISQIL